MAQGTGVVFVNLTIDGENKYMDKSFEQVKELFRSGSQVVVRLAHYMEGVDWNNNICVFHLIEVADEGMRFWGAYDMMWLADGTINI